MCSGYGITFDSAGSWSFDNDFARNDAIFGVDNSLSSHSDNRKNNFLVLCEGPTNGINGSFGSPEKKLSINFTKANTKFCLRLHYNADYCYLFVNRKEIFKFKAENKNVNFPSQFCLKSIFNGFSNPESREVSLNGNVYDFSVDYNSIDKSDILNIHKYFMTKNIMSSLFIVLLSFNQTKCLFLNDKPYMFGPAPIDMNPAELKYYPLMISFKKCSGSCNVLSQKMCSKRNKRHNC